MPKHTVSKNKQSSSDLQSCLSHTSRHPSRTTHLSTSQVNSSLSDNHCHLLERLLHLEISLSRKINQIKQEKIQILEDYNREYDRFSDLEMQDKSRTVLRKDQIKNVRHLKQTDSDVSERNNQQNAENKLKSYLVQHYEREQNNNYEETKLSQTQLQQLDQLMKLENRSLRRYMQNQSDFQNQHAYHSANYPPNRNPSAGMISQQIYILQSLTSETLSKRLTILKSHHKINSIYQRQSLQEVDEMVRKRIFFDKQVQKMDQTLKQMERMYEDQHGREIQQGQQMNSFTKTASQKSWKMKWESICKYNKLKAALRQMQEQTSASRLNRPNRPNRPNANNSDQTNENNLQYPHLYRQKRGSVQKLNRLKQSETLDKESEIKCQLQVKIREYEDYLRNQNMDKAKLHGQIQAKNNEFLQLKRQNRLLSQLIKLIS